MVMGCSTNNEKVSIYVSLRFQWLQYLITMDMGSSTNDDKFGIMPASVSNDCGSINNDKVGIMSASVSNDCSTS